MLREPRFVSWELFIRKSSDIDRERARKPRRAVAVSFGFRVTEKKGEEWGGNELGKGDSREI